MEADAIGEGRIIADIVFLFGEGGAVAVGLARVVATVYKLAQTDTRGLFRTYDVQVSQRSS